MCSPSTILRTPSSFEWGPPCSKFALRGFRLKVSLQLFSELWVASSGVHHVRISHFVDLVLRLVFDYYPKSELWTPLGGWSFFYLLMPLLQTYNHRSFLESDQLWLFTGFRPPTRETRLRDRLSLVKIRAYYDGLFGLVTARSCPLGIASTWTGSLDGFLGDYSLPPHEGLELLKSSRNMGC